MTHQTPHGHRRNVMQWHPVLLKPSEKLQGIVVEQTKDSIEDICHRALAFRRMPIAAMLLMHWGSFVALAPYRQLMHR